jgi:hypothetical protein
LTAFYDSTGGANWDDNDGWLGEKDECDWYGITCNDSSLVTAIDLPNNKLTGSIELGSLTSLGEYY